MNKKRIILASAVLIALSGIGYWMVGESNVIPALTFASAKVALGNISESVTATGSIEPVTEVEVGTQVSGIIDKIYVDYNATVCKGQLIAEMDRVTLQTEVASQKAAYNGAKAEYEYQQKNCARTRELYQKKLVSDADYELAVYNYEKASSNYESSRAALARAERNLAYATITSPIDGVVISKSVEEGQTVASGFETPTLFTIAADLTQMQVVADVDEADIGGVKEGQRVSFTVDAYPNDVFEGRVTQIRLGSSSSTNSTASSNASTVVTYEVVIAAPNPDLKLKPRLTANVTIYTLDCKNVLCIPIRALRFTPEPALVGEDMVIEDCAGHEKVWTLQGNTFTAHPIITGISNGIYTEVKEGIGEGTAVITEVEPQVAAGRDGLNFSPSDAGERSPFMPGPPGSDRKQKK